VVQNAKKLMAQKLILSSPNVKLSKMLPPATAEMKQFFRFTFRNNILCNLKEAHLSFKEENPEKLLRFLKFAELQIKTVY
jgi:hypothetical protein